MTKYSTKKCAIKMLARAIIASGWFTLGMSIFKNNFEAFNVAMLAVGLLTVFITHMCALFIFKSIEELP